MPRFTHELLRYYLDRPDTIESLEGLVRWRLGTERITQTIAEVGAALEWLVAEGLLCPANSPTSAPVFSLNRQRETEARDLVDDV